jgi:hypothetical protein
MGTLDDLSSVMDNVIIQLPEGDDMAKSGEGAGKGWMRGKVSA